MLYCEVVISSCSFNYLCIFAYTSSNTAQFYSKAALETSENVLECKSLLSTYKKNKNNFIRTKVNHVCTYICELSSLA